MPGLPTAELVKRFAQAYPDSPILICSGHVDAELLRRGIRAGDYAFLAKPFTGRALVARIAEILQEAPA